MKFKKFLIIILSVALLSCFAVSTFATDATTAATIPEYGFYISPGEYVFDEVLDFSFNGFVINFDFIAFQGQDYHFYTSMQVNNRVVYFFGGNVDNNYGVSYSDGEWSDDRSRYVTVSEGFYIYDINIYQWWLSNATAVDSGYDNNLLDGILSSFTFIGEWIAGAANAVTPMFWDGEALTVVGTLSVAGLSFAVVFLLIALVSSFMKFRS